MQTLEQRYPRNIKCNVECGDDLTYCGCARFSSANPQTPGSPEELVEEWANQRKERVEQRLLFGQPDGKIPDMPRAVRKPAPLWHGICYMVARLLAAFAATSFINAGADMTRGDFLIVWLLAAVWLEIVSMRVAVRRR